MKGKNVKNLIPIVEKKNVKRYSMFLLNLYRLLKEKVSQFEVCMPISICPVIYVHT